MGLRLNGGRFESDRLQNHDAGQIRRALMSAIQDGAIDFEAGMRLIDQGQVGLAAALQLPEVQERLNSVARSVLGGK